MKLVKSYLKKNRCYTNAIKINIKGIIVHSTGVAQPDVNVFLKGWNNAKVSKCVHAFVSQDRVTQTLPWNYKGWHCGGSGNNSYIGFEILEPSGHTYKGATMINYDVSKNATYFKKVYNNAVELCAMLCEKYDLDPEKNIYCHKEAYTKGLASNHADVMHWFPKHNKDMDQFRAAVKAKMKGDKEIDVTPDEPETTTVYRVQLGSYSKKENAVEAQSDFKKKGLSVSVVKKGSNYIVCAGNYTKKADAESYNTTLKKKGYSGYVVALTKTTTSKFPYKVRINTKVLNVRSGPSTSYKIVTTVKKDEVYTIVGEKNGWGKLKSGVGYIKLSYTK